MTLYSRFFQQWSKLVSRQKEVKPQVTEIILKRRQIFILPTRSGFLFAGVLLVMLLGSMNYNNSLGYMLTFLLGSMAIVSTLHTHRNLLGLQAKIGKVNPVFAGETMQFQLLIDNQNHAARYALAFERCVNRSIWNTATISHVIDIPENQVSSVYFTVPTQQRGKMQLGKIMVATQFPLGLFRAWAYIDLDFSGIVYPKPQGNRQLPHTFSDHTQSSRENYEGKGDDFIGYRDYQLGDSPRHVDWKAVARQQGWLIKQFGGGEVSQQIWLSWQNVALTDIETVLSQLCLWVLVADEQNAQYGLQLPTQQIKMNSGEQHRADCLKALALCCLERR